MIGEVVFIIHRLQRHILKRWFRNPTILSLAVMLSWVTTVESVSAQSNSNISWNDFKTRKKGTLVVHWYESRPFIFKDKTGALSGIEYDLINSFANYVNKEFKADLSFEWTEAQGFNNVFTQVVQSPTPCLGASAFSITPKRKEQASFSPPYMSDIMVLISNQSVPLIESADEFRSTFSNRQAITILGTTYESELLSLKLSQGMSFEIEYIPSALNILETVESRPNSFGFIDLSIYLMNYSNNPALSVKRQNFYPIKGEGYGLIIPKNSDWIEPVSAFFYRADFKKDLEMIISKYLDIELYKLNERLALKANSSEELLLKEKEIQYRDLLNKAKEIESKTRANYVLVALVVLAVLFSVVIIAQSIKQNQQRKKIETQQEKIELANRQLEQRNQHLLAINEEKNNLIKILAHDMRQPLSQIEGLSHVLQDNSTPAEQHEVMGLITDAAQRLSRMISNILNVDAIDSKRVEFVAEKVDVTPLIQKVLESFEPSAQKKRLTLQFENPDSRLSVKADPLYLTQILENLISNAIKFSPAGLSIWVNIYQTNNNVRISVRDEGPGLTVEDKGRLFMKFQKLSARPTAGESSTGLGLAIVSKYVGLMNGKVWCKSEPGKGATFLVEFAKGE